eukprot:scaffold39829_cov28-Phaeocystis_antarctica.AAC.1
MAAAPLPPSTGLPLLGSHHWAPTTSGSSAQPGRCSGVSRAQQCQPREAGVARCVWRSREGGGSHYWAPERGVACNARLRVRPQRLCLPVLGSHYWAPTIGLQGGGWLVTRGCRSSARAVPQPPTGIQTGPQINALIDVGPQCRDELHGGLLVVLLDNLADGHL